MPHPDEQSSYIALSRILGNSKVQEYLGQCHTVSSPQIAEENTSSAVRLQLSNVNQESMPRFILAIDGSMQHVTVDNGFPGAEIGFVTAAVVLLDFARINVLRNVRYPNPVEVQRTTTSEAGELVLPGCNVQRTGTLDPKQAFRERFFEELASVRVAKDGESLLDTFHALLSYKAETREERCPYDDCHKVGGNLDRGTGAYTCSCPLSRPLYATDTLRIHEAFNPVGPSGEAYGEVMQVTERLLLINFLRTLEQKGMLDTLSHIALFMDGPLAVFGHPAWLKDAIAKELRRLNDCFRSATGRDILLIGIEKSGAFMEHFRNLDTNSSGSPGAFPPRTALLLTDQYIKRYIILSTSERPYGYQTYFGRKFFYKTASGARIVAMTPFLREEHADLSVARADQYPRLAEVTTLLDALVSSRYQDALVPIVEAHAYATIARGLGTEVLTRLVQELVRRDN